MKERGYSSDKKLAVALIILLGVAFGVVVGYFALAADKGADGAPPFYYYMQYPERSGAVYWAVFGGIVAWLLFYIRELLRR